MSTALLQGRALDHVVVVANDLEATSNRYEAMGFTLTSKAQHNEEMGTSNRLIQLTNKTFIELLEVDRPAGIKAHKFEEKPGFFSFGEHNKAFLSKNEGMSMLAFQTANTKEDTQHWQNSNVTTYEPFNFDRKATLPDGSLATLSFSLGFASSAQMPLCSFFVCQNGAPQHFWKQEFQQHANTAKGITEITICSENPQQDADFVLKLFGGNQSTTDGGMTVATSDSQSINILTPEAVAALDSTVDTSSALLPRFVGITLTVQESDKAQWVQASDAGGLFLNLVQHKG